MQDSSNFEMSSFHGSIKHVALVYICSPTAFSLSYASMREEIAEVRPRVAGFQVSIEHLWLGLPVFALLWKSFLFPLPFLDFWWHLKIGEVIATTRSIPRIDLFFFTAAGQPFIVQNWLAELLYYGTYRFGGFRMSARCKPCCCSMWSSI